MRSEMSTSGAWSTFMTGGSLASSLITYKSGSAFFSSLQGSESDSELTYSFWSNSIVIIIIILIN